MKCVYCNKEYSDKVISMHQAECSKKPVEKEVKEVKKEVKEVK